MKTLKLIFVTCFLLNSSFLFALNSELKGIVTDATNNEPIPFATVLIEGTQIGVVTELDGTFTFTDVPPGYVKIQVSLLGYKTVTSESVLITNTSIPYLEIQLEEASVDIDQVVITADVLEKNIDAPISMQRIGIKQIEGNPGSNRDISRVIQSFPGVGSTPAFRNDVIIRGGGPSENRFFLDGVEIPVLNHFSTQGASGGPVGIINADFIKSVDFYSGGFPSSRYNALSGVFNFKQKDGSHDKTNLQAAIGASEAALTVDGPIGKKTSYIFSMRRSYLQFLFSAIGLPFLPTFNDYQLKVKTDIDAKNKLTIISIGSLDNLTLNNAITDPDPSQEYILTQIPINNQWSYTIGGVYKHFGKHGYHTVVLSRNMLNNSFYKYPDNDESQEKSFDYTSSEAENKFRYEYTFRKLGVKYNFTTSTELAKYYNSTAQQVFINNSLTKFEYSSDLNVLKYGLSAQASKRFFKDRFLISAGIRADANDYNNETKNLLNQLSPRLATSFSIDPKTALNAGVGRYYQQAAYTTLGFRNGEGELQNENSAKYIGADHLNIGLEHRFNKEILTSVEGFYKQYFQYPIDMVSGASLANQGAGYSSIAGASLVSFTGRGEALGFEVLNRMNFERLSVIASYTYVRSSFTDINDKMIPSSWDSKHLFTLTGSKEFSNNWKLGMKWRYVGGLPYTPYDLETSAYVQAWNANGQAYLDFNQLNTERFEAFHQLDLRLDKNFFFNKWSLMVYLDIQNAYNFQNKSQDFIVRKKNEDGTYMTEENGTKYVLESIENTSGTVLPTVGIMIKF